MTERQPVSPIRPEESVTTREEIDMDDNEQEPATVSPLAQEALSSLPAKSPSPMRRVSFQEGHEEILPPKPPRPLSPLQQAENTLIEAFPAIDTKVVKAVLTASNGKVEPAFNALLGMSDPDFRVEQEVSPPQPPRPTSRQPLTQVEADELYARQLAEHYSSGGQRSQNRYNQREPNRRGPNQQRHYEDEEDRDRSFFDDDLPEIGKSIQQGFLETQKKVNSWITTFKKKLDGDDEEDEDLYSSSQNESRQNTVQWPGRQNYGPSQSEQLYGIRKSSDQQRRSTEAQRYDADPRELGEEEFERLELKDEEFQPPQPTRPSNRKSANSDLFKPQPKPPQDGPVDEVEAAERRVSGKNASEADKGRKWQPLTSVGSHPEDDNDPFALGDDDEDKDKNDDVRVEYAERLKESASHGLNAGTSSEAGKGAQLSANEVRGVKDKTAEEILKK